MILFKLTQFQILMLAYKAQPWCVAWECDMSYSAHCSIILVGSVLALHYKYHCYLFCLVFILSDIRGMSVSHWCIKDWYDIVTYKDMVYAPVIYWTSSSMWWVCNITSIHMHTYEHSCHGILWWLSECMQTRYSFLTMSGYGLCHTKRCIASMMQCVMCSTAAWSTGYLLHVCSFVLTLVSTVCLILCICVMWICGDVGFSDIVCIAGNYHRVVM